MGSKIFIPELHDIGKLVDSKVKEDVERQIGKSWKGHVFTDFNFQKLGISQPTSPSWWGQYHHEIKHDKNIENWNNIPPDFRFNLFLLILADHLASSVSRATFELDREKTSGDGILKLWNKNYYNLQKKKGKHWAAFRTVDDLKILFSEIQNCQSGEELLEKYKEYLLLTPEDKSIPRNVTSLYTHIELVGKIYRILERNTRVITEPDGTTAVEYNGIKVKTIKEAEGGRGTIGTCGNNWYCINCVEFNSCNIAKGKWQARLIKCWIKFPHSFVRLHDINLLRKREEFVNYIASHYKDEIIFTTSDFITLFLPSNQDLKEIFKPLLDWGFYIEVEETLADLGILNSILDRKTLRARELNDQPRLNVLNNRGTKVYRSYLMPEISNELQPPICDICQQRKGIERIKETIREWICEKCQEIRDMGEPFREYATVWEKEGVRVCWFKVSLDQKKLEKWLQRAFKKYIDKIVEKKRNESQDIQEKIYKKLSTQEKKQQEKKKLIEKVKELSDKEEKKKMGQKIKKISDEIKVIASDIEQLEKKKKNLEEEVNKLEDSKDEFRPLALQVDFNKDYKEMLKEFWKELGRIDVIKKPIVEYDELGVFRYSPELTKMIIERFLNLFERYFPDCDSDDDSPISLSLSIASVKYPIREHWRFFEENSKNFLNVRYHKVFDEKYSKDELKIIIEKIINMKTSSSFLHKLIQLEESLQSEIHIVVNIFNNRKKYPEIYELLSKGIKPSKFLNLYRLLKGEEQ